MGFVLYFTLPHPFMDMALSWRSELSMARVLFFLKIAPMEMCGVKTAEYGDDEAKIKRLGVQNQLLIIFNLPQG